MLAVIGSLSRDRIGGEERVGGGAYHAARGLRLLSARATIVAKAADRSLVPPLVELGVPVRFHDAATTTGFDLEYTGEERRLEVTEVGEPWSAAEAEGWVADALGRIRFVHVAPLLRSDFPAETLAVLARGRRLLLDGQGLVRRPQTGPLELDDDFDPELLRHVSILKLAEEEARVVLPDVRLDSLAQLGVDEVLVTFGARGSLVYADGELERIPARPVDAEATGAGDVFCAAYLAGRAESYAPVAAARRAASIVEMVLERRV